jgi:hypothetical protein
MVAIVTVLFAFPLGWLFSSRLAANTSYAVVYLWAFVFQSVYLLLSTMEGRGSSQAFETDVFPWQYGLVTLGVFSVGLALVEVGHRTRARRRTRTAVAATIPG